MLIGSSAVLMTFNPIIVRFKRNVTGLASVPASTFNPIIVRFKLYFVREGHSYVITFNPIIVRFKLVAKFGGNFCLSALSIL